MLRAGLDHPKTLDFAARLGVSRPQAIGHLELLWAFTADKAPRGDVGKWPDGAIARACDWMDAPEVFVEALTAAGFIDESEAHRLLIHDWPEHAPRFVRAKPAVRTDGFCSPDCSGDCSSDSSGDSKPSPSKPSQAKEENAPAALPPGLDQKAWGEWLDYRRSRRLPKYRTNGVAEKLAQLQKQAQRECVKHSIDQGYQGLFPEKFQSKPQAKKQSAVERVRQKAMEKWNG